MLLAALTLSLSLMATSTAITSRSLTLRVYPGGYVGVDQTMGMDPKASSVQVPLLASAVSGLVATDQNGSPLSYGFSGSGGNITVYTLGATEVNLHYDTDNLTSKSGSVWTLAFTTSYNSTVVLPQDSTLGFVSGTPYSINQTDQYPEMTLSPGTWRIDYGVPFDTTGSTATTSTVPPSTTPGTSSGSQDWWLAGGAAAVAVAVLAYFWWRSRGIGPVSRDLRPDDLQVLHFIREKGGKVLEPEIRTKFALPKTTAWRQIKRLERLGYVRVVKIGSQNQIELLRDRNLGE